MYTETKSKFKRAENIVLTIKTNNTKYVKDLIKDLAKHDFNTFAYKYDNNKLLPPFIIGTYDINECAIQLKFQPIENEKQYEYFKEVIGKINIFDYEIDDIELSVDETTTTVSQH